MPQPADKTGYRRIDYAEAKRRGIHHEPVEAYRHDDDGPYFLYHDASETYWQAPEDED
jgi:hypothetical protein